MCVAHFVAKAKEKAPNHFVVGKRLHGIGRNEWNYQVKPLTSKQKRDVQAPPLVAPFWPTRKPQLKLQQHKRWYNTLCFVGMGRVERTFVVLLVIVLQMSFRLINLKVRLLPHRASCIAP